MQNELEELRAWARGERCDLLASTTLAKRALQKIEKGEAKIVLCKWEEWDAPGYNAVARAMGYISYYDDILFAPFSSTAPGRIGKGGPSLSNQSWMVVSAVGHQG